VVHVVQRTGTGGTADFEGKNRGVQSWFDKKTYQMQCMTWFTKDMERRQDMNIVYPKKGRTKQMYYNSIVVNAHGSKCDALLFSSGKRDVNGNRSDEYVEGVDAKYCYKSKRGLRDVKVVLPAIDGE
jgi:hypothetical protein